MNQRIKKMIISSGILARQIAEEIDNLLVANNIEQPRKDINMPIFRCIGQTHNIQQTRNGIKNHNSKAFAFLNFRHQQTPIKEPLRVKVSLHLTGNFIKILYHDDVCSFDLKTGKKISNGTDAIQKIAPFVTAAIKNLHADIEEERRYCKELKDWDVVKPDSEDDNNDSFFVSERYDESKNSAHFDIADKYLQNALKGEVFESKRFNSR